MRITIFTSNQPRHISLIENLSQIADEVYAIVECLTVFPGEVADFFKTSVVMQKYFKRVISAEKQIFGSTRFLPKNVKVLAIKSGDLKKLQYKILEPALKSDEYIVFGSSYIKDDLLDYLICNRAYNLHMGVSPYYRGSSSNFWAAYDGNLDYVGATIHLLSEGIDSGDLLFHAFPEETDDPFLLGMKAVMCAHTSLIEYLKSGKLQKMKGVPQDTKLEIRYTRNSDFTDSVAEEYLKKLPDSTIIKEKIRDRQLNKFLNPYIG